MAKGQIKVGTWTGTGSAITLQLGFVPDFFMAFNVTDGDYATFWFNGMSAGTSIDIAAAVASNAADGVTVYDGTAGGNAAGLTLGTDLSESAKVYRYIAIGEQ
jgi:hypothetical protein